MHKLTRTALAMKGKGDPDKVAELLHELEDEDGRLPDAGIDSDDEKSSMSDGSAESSHSRTSKASEQMGARAAAQETAGPSRCRPAKQMTEAQVKVLTTSTLLIFGFWHGMQ